MTDPIRYQCIRTGEARKAGQHSTGTLAYAVLKDAAATEAFLIVTGNSTAGYFSREAVPLARIQECLASLPPEASISAKALRPAFRGKSANDGGFLLALLRHEGLITPSPDASNLNVRNGDWDAWRQAVLAAPGEPFEIPTKAGLQPMTPSTLPPTSEAAITNAPGLPGKARKVRKDREPTSPHPTAQEDEHHEPSA